MKKMSNRKKDLIIKLLKFISVILSAIIHLMLTVRFPDKGIGPIIGLIQYTLVWILILYVF